MKKELKKLAVDFLRGIWEGIGKPPSELKKPRPRRIVGPSRRHR